MSKTTSKKKKILRDYGLKRPWFITYKARLVIGLISFLAILISFLVQFFLQKDGANYGVLIVTLGAFILAYQQWDEAKNETSIDKYYERLNLTNSKFNSWIEARAMFPYFWDGIWEGEEARKFFQRTMYVYLELDNLEYAIEKYQLGYMGIEITYRSLETFKSRCYSKEFCRLAMKYVKLSKGYQETTEIVVSKIIKTIYKKEEWHIK